MEIISYNLDVCNGVLHLLHVDRFTLYDRFGSCIYHYGHGTCQAVVDLMTWEEMYNQSLKVIAELNKEIETLRAIVRVQLPIIEGDDENLQNI